MMSRRHEIFAGIQQAHQADTTLTLTLTLTLMAHQADTPLTLVAHQAATTLTLTLTLMAHQADTETLKQKIRQWAEHSGDSTQQYTGTKCGA